MIRVLIIIAVAGFVLALACFTGAAALGGRELLEKGWTFPAELVIEDDGDTLRVTSRESAGPQSEKDLAWPGGNLLQIDAPAEVTYVQGAAATVSVSGPQGLVERVVLTDGRLRLADNGRPGEGLDLRLGRDRLRVVVTAPSVTRFVLNGSPDLRVEGYDQPEMQVEINGSGDVAAAGRAESVSLSIAGSGDAELDELTVRDAAVAIAGSGNASLSPTGAVKVSIAGSGDVALGAKPASLTSDIDGSGDLHLPD
ncbi:MAG: GIN domain-containing protein [Pseudomonadota bacterium]